MSKFPIKQLEHKSRKRYDLYTLVSLPNGFDIIVINVHLCHKEEYFERRAVAMQNIVKVAEELYTYDENEKVENAISNKNVIILGDFNYHLQDETQNIYKNGFSDLWLEPGHHYQMSPYTWDGQKNSMITAFLPFDNRRMRLDRIILNQKAKNVDFVDI